MTDLADGDDRRPASHEKSPRDRRARRTRRCTSNLSASGSRNAPERVVPSRRASQPSSRSVHASTNQQREGEPRRALVASMSISVGTVSSSRAIVTKFAGRRGSAVRRRTRRTRRSATVAALAALALARAPCRRAHGSFATRSGPTASVTCARTSAPGRAAVGVEAHDAVDLGRLAVGAADQRHRRLVVAARRRARRPRCRRARRARPA